MASVNFMKCHDAGTAKAMMRHSEKEERLAHEHSNPDIDKALTVQNSSLYGLSYEEMCRKYDERIRFLDETTNTNKRSDRVTMFSLEYSVPEDLPAWLEEQFLTDCEKLIAEQYGERNIIESERHMDEKHKYIDHGQEKVSRAHGHTFVVPEIDGKLNGKTFSSKSQMMRLNKKIDEMAVQKYQVHFMTGKGARHQSVEELKRASTIEQQELSIQRNEELLQRQMAAAQDLKAERDELTNEISSLKANCEQEARDLQVQYQAKQARLDADYAERKKLIAEMEEKLVQKAQALEGRELDLEELKELDQKTFWSSADKENVLKTARLSATNASKAERMKHAKQEAIKEQKKLQAQVDDLEKKVPSFQEQLHYKGLESRLEEDKRTIQALKDDIKVRDTFIEKQGLKSQFMSYCRDIGHHLKIAVEEISHSMRIR